MEAKDSVIKGGVKQELIIYWSNTITGHLLGWQPTLEHNAHEKFDAWVKEIRLEQAEISWKLRTDDILKQLKGFNQRGLTITEAIELLQ